VSEDLYHVVTNRNIPESRRRLGRFLVWGSFAAFILTALAQVVDALHYYQFGFANWQPTLIAYVVWAALLCVGQVLIHGEQGKRLVFVLPAALFVVSLTVIPLIFGIAIALSSWNLSSPLGPQFNGVDNIRQMLTDPFYWNALTNMVWYCLGILVQYTIAFGLALLLNAEIRARRFFRVAFLLPLMLSPVAVSWMIGKSMLEVRFGPIARIARALGWDNPAFFATPELAKVTMMLMDAWTWIPLMMLMLLAGLQAIPRELIEAARVDGATAWKSFWKVTFPLMLPVTITVLLVRLIFELKLADIVINVTSGGPGGATDTVTSFIWREYRDRSNVGYGTLLAMVYLVIIVVVMTILMRLADRLNRRYT
jgi:multiple sugar transport system permease protein